MDFYFSWHGNKRKEIKEFIHLIDIDKYDTFVEPFGGSLSFSRYIFDNYPNKNFLICDNDENLTKFCNNFYKNKQHILNNVVNKINTIKNKDEYYQYVKQPYSDNIDDFMTQYLFFNKVCSIRKGLYPDRGFCKFHKYKEKTEKTDEFFNNNVYKNIDFKEHLEKVKNDRKAFVFLDPPYPINSECGFYKHVDTLRIWEYLIDFIKCCKCDFIMIMNSNIFIDIIFKEFIIGRYDKKYDINSTLYNGDKFKKKRATHLIISNIKYITK